MRNPDRMPSPMTPEEKMTPERRKSWGALKEMAEIGRGEAPEPAQDWNLIWVLSGPPIDIAERFDIAGEVLFEHGASDAEGDIKRRINESRERLEMGISIAKRVAALRLGKEEGELTPEDLKTSSPDIYWNARDWANDNLSARIAEGFLDQYGFPAEKVIVSPNLGIKNTRDQFEKLEEAVVPTEGKVVIVSDTYHLPRVELANDKLDEGRVVFYPSETGDPKKKRRIPVAKALDEIRSIPERIKGKTLPKNKWREKE